MGHGSSYRCAFSITLALAAADDLGHAAAEEAGPTLLPASTDWAIRPPLPDPKDAGNISGAACYEVNGERKSCLLAGDEARHACFFRIDGQTIVPGPTIKLFPHKENDVAVSEADIEGVSFSNGYYYLTGSHGLARHNAEFQASRFLVFRFEVDAETGMPSLPFPPDVEKSDNLRKMIAEAPELGAYAEKPLGEHGVNIEGLAVRNHHLFLGFRAPVLDGKAFVMSVDVDAVFGNTPAGPHVYSIALGDGVGVRDLVAVEGGFLVLGGPEMDEPGAAKLFFWDGQSTAPKRLGRLAGLPEGAKPEAVLVLAEDTEAYRLLIMSDGIAGGAPLEYRVPK